ncbi:MAG: LytR C-terminal domain-containing protein [Solirubrobacteraceae bacterium]
MATGTVPFALSISHFINKVGSDAGFAAIIGLAILVLLYFAQARETATLREHAADAGERIRQLEGRITQLMRAAQSQAAGQQGAPGQAGQRPAPGQALRQAGAASRVAGAVPPPAAMVGTGAAAVAAGAQAGTPGRPPGPAPLRIAPAGVGAPALSAATKLIPTDVPAATALAEPPAAPSAVPGFGSDGVATNGHTVAGSAKDAGAGVVGQPPAPPRPPAAVPAPGGGLSGPPRVQLRSGLPSSARGAPPVPPGRRPLSGRELDGDGDEPTSVGRRLAYGLAALIVLAVVVVVLITLTSSSGTATKTNGTPTTNAPAPGQHHRKHAVIPANVTVSVLNGTATAHLAGNVLSQLVSLGYKQGYKGNAGVQTQTTTQVAYLPGFRRDALAVARALKLPSADVAPLGPATQCPAPTPCAGNVVVTIGADLVGGATANTTPATNTTTPTSTGAGQSATNPVGTSTGAGTTTAPAGAVTGANTSATSTSTGG